MTADTRTADQLATAAEAAALDAHDATEVAQADQNADRHAYARAAGHAVAAQYAAQHAADSATRGGPLAAPAARSWARLARLHATAAEHAASEVVAAAGGDPSYAAILEACDWHRADAAAQLVHASDALARHPDRAEAVEAAHIYAERAAEAADAAAGCVDHVHPSDSDTAEELARQAREYATEARRIVDAAT